MPRMFIKIVDDEKRKFFLEWSTVSDAPNSMVVPEYKFKHMYDELGYKDYDGDVQRLNKTGVSNPHYTLDELLEMSGYTMDELLTYCQTFINLK